MNESVINGEAHHKNVSGVRHTTRVIFLSWRVQMRSQAFPV